jgi:hypothetical protein
MKSWTECSLAQHRFLITFVRHFCRLCVSSCDDAILESAGKLRKLWDSLSELRSSLCERLLEMTILRPALLSVKTAQFTQFFHTVSRHTLISLSLTESVGSLRLTLHTTMFNTHKFYVLPKLHLCNLRGSQNKQWLFLYTALTYRFL